MTTESTHPALQQLAPLRQAGGRRDTPGLPDEVVARFLATDPSLAVAIERAAAVFPDVQAAYPDLVAADEEAQVTGTQGDLVNFYGRDLMNPYVALAADGPWIVTLKGAVIHDSGGYGMLGQGHAPASILEALAAPQAMANVMTASMSQRRLIDALKREIGHSREGACPFEGFLFLNSGSESVTMAARIADVNAREMTEPEGPHAGKPIRRLALRGSFHGRTHRSAQFSDSGFATYCRHLASFRDGTPLHTVEPNDVTALEQAFADAEREGAFIEALFLEPVMGEGNPGLALQRSFYDAARALTAKHGALLLVDSIQAGLRAHGVLSILDYPGFADAEAPDLETYSKALNAGQYPLSVLAMSARAVALYRPGIYGNTMTAAPRAMDVASAVLDGLTPALRENIRRQGTAFVGKLASLAASLEGTPAEGAIVGVQGTGLLVACALDPTRYLSHGADSTEWYLRTRGIGVIHGGTNALRYTPHFGVTDAELDLIVEALRDALENGPRR